MNTPKKIIRYTNRVVPKQRGPEGTCHGGIHNAEFARLLGEAVGDWSQIEDRMVSIMGLLLSPDTTVPARQIYRSFTSAQLRIKAMWALLQTAKHNQTKSAEFDAIIQEFGLLNSIRNDYMHGRWWTHESGDVWLQPESKDDFDWLEMRKVEQRDIEQFKLRMIDLHNLIQKVR